MNTRQIRIALVPLLVAALLLSGCSSGYVALDREDLLQDDAALSYRVTLNDGTMREFISLSLEGESLVGTERVTTETIEGEGEAADTGSFSDPEQPPRRSTARASISCVWRMRGWREISTGSSSALVRPARPETR